jgi:hypothetical protein
MLGLESCQTAYYRSAEVGWSRDNLGPVQHITGGRDDVGERSPDVDGDT